MGLKATDALLHLRFYRPLFELFESTFGRRVLCVLKPDEEAA